MGAPSVQSELEKFQWHPQPEAARLVRSLVDEFLAKNPHAARFARRMKDETGTRFIDWIDHISVSADGPAIDKLKKELARTGFTRTPARGALDCYAHHGAMFPRVQVETGPAALRVAIKVESAADFLAVHSQLAAIGAAGEGEYHHAAEIRGETLSQLRFALAYATTSGAKDYELWVVERHGYLGFEPLDMSAGTRTKVLSTLEAFRTRRRDFGIGPEADLKGFEHASRIADRAIADLSRDWACDIFFQSERDYWQRRNRAAQFQYGRQAALGLGWANHDHHTYRSSRHCFKHLIAFLEKLGFACRERFYAGAEAGWGAQVIEQPVAGITIFADVDMSPEELLGDFSHAGLVPRPQLGTVGLWCALHGEAFLQAGMHHLECQFDWHALKEQMAHGGIKTMDPFTTFPYLRQAFTEGERWKVREDRLAALLASKAITQQQADQFRTQGALGSHLENLERNDGYKGFNQTGVSSIIAKTDPRKQLQAAGA